MDMITDRVQGEAEAWHRRYNKPVLMSEYGADTMPGLHEVKTRYMTTKTRSSYVYNKLYLFYIYFKSNIRM